MQSWTAEEKVLLIWYMKCIVKMIIANCSRVSLFFRTENWFAFEMESFSTFYKMIKFKECQLFATQPINNKPRAEICSALLTYPVWKGLYDVIVYNDRHYTCCPGSPSQVPTSFFHFLVLSKGTVLVLTKIPFHNLKIPMRIPTCSKATMILALPLQALFAHVYLNILIKTVI